MADPFLITWQGIEIVQLAQLAVFILSPVAMILTANLLTEEKHLKWMVICYLLVTTYGILAEVLSLPFRLNLRGLNSTWVVGILYGLLLFKPDLSRWWKLTFLFIIGLFLFRFFYMGITWLSGWLPIIVMIVVITFLRSRKALMIMLILGMVAVVVFLPWLQNQFAAEYTESGGNRLEKWIFLFQQPFVWNHVLLGTGPFGYARYFMTYFPENAASTHSNYIDIFLQTGVVGSFIFSFLLVALAWEWWKIYRVSIRSTFLRSYHITAMGGLIAILVAMSLGDWFTPFVLNQGLHGFSWTVQNWIFLGGLLALPKILKNMQTAPTAKMQ
jgi:O-antigen ligase